MVAGTEPRPSVARPTVIIATVCAFTIKGAAGREPHIQAGQGGTLDGPQLLLPRAGERRWRTLFRRWRPSGSYCRWQLLCFATLTAFAFRVVSIGIHALSKPVAPIRCDLRFQTNPAGVEPTRALSRPVVAGIEPTCKSHLVEAGRIELPSNTHHRQHLGVISHIPTTISLQADQSPGELVDGGGTHIKQCVFPTSKG